MTYTKAELDVIIEYTNGYPMTYGDYLDNMGIEYEVI